MATDPDQKSGGKKVQVSGIGGQLLLLLWKNLKLQLRSYILTILIIALPVLLIGLLVYLRTVVDNEIYDEPKVYQPLRLLPWDSTADLDMLNLPSSSNSTEFRVFYYPSNTLTDSIMTQAASFSDMLTFEGLSTLTERSNTFDDIEGSDWAISDILGMVEFSREDGSAFPNSGALPTDLKLTIRLSHSRRFEHYGFNDVVVDDNPRLNNWQTEENYQPANFGPRQLDAPTAAFAPGYYEEGFLSLQLAVNLGMLKHAGYWLKVNETIIEVNRIPYPPYEENVFNAILNTLLPFVFVVCMISLVLMVVKQLVLEKERRLKESMKMMGMRTWIHNAAWLIHFSVIFLIVSIALALILTMKIVEQGAIFPQADFGGVFFIFLFYSIQAISCCFLLSALFSNANTAGVMTGVIWFFTWFPYLFLDPGNPNGFYDSLNPSFVSLLSFIPNLAFSFAVLMLTSLEDRGIGAKLSTLTEARTFNDDLTLGHIFLSQLISSILYITLTWYLDNVRPGIYGVPKSPIFCFKPSYWSSKFAKEQGRDEADGPDPNENPDNFEPDPQGFKVGIRIENLKKIYGNGKMAVKGISINMFQGQITAFLGHNGAGKTSTISMLTGLYAPTSGRAKINGFDIRTDMEKVRQSLGICPQHDVLYDNLTVAEHLKLFCKLKGLESGKIAQETRELLTDLELIDKINFKASELSGGMKRKLSVAIAFCAGSKVVILDEPTSGMDPSARRKTWDLIQKYRKDRTIILTTHYMDEADFLGDRIAIMSSGQLVCAGTSLFLKNRYGVGYHMVTEKEKACDADRVFNFIRQFVPGVEQESNVGAELTFRLPQESVTNFPSMFDDLEKQKGSLGIASYGVSVTTLEEVFMRVGHLNEEAEANATGEKPPSYSSANTKEGSPRHQNSGFLQLKRNRAKLNGLVDSNRVSPEFEGIVDPKYNSPHNDEDLPDVGSGNLDGTLNGGFEADVPIEEGVIVTSSFSNSKGFTKVKRNTGVVLFLQQLQSLLVKRFINTRRSLALSISQILVPVIFTTLALVFVNYVVPPSGNMKPLTFKLDIYEPNKVTVYDPNDDFAALQTAYIDALGNSYDIEDAADSGLNLTDFFANNGRGREDEFNLHWIVGASFEKGVSPLDKYTAWFNGQPYHSAPLALQLLMNGILREKIGAGAPKVTLVNHPLPKNLQERKDEADEPTADGFLLSFYMAGLGLGFLMASFAVFLIRERAVKSKHIQMVSGVNVATYWLSTFLWDLFNYMITALLLLILVVAFRIEGWTGTQAGILFLILVLYAWAMLPMMYLISGLFSVAANGFLVLALLNIILTIGLAITYFVMRGLDSSAIDTVIFFGFFFPQFSISACLIDVPVAYSRNVLNRLQGTAELDYLSTDYPGIGDFVIFMFVDGLMYWAILLLAEFGLMNYLQMICCRFCCCCCRVRSRKVPAARDGGPETAEIGGNSGLDSDVLAEKQRLMALNSSDAEGKTVLAVKGITKTYRNTFQVPVHKAVHGIFVGIEEGECFGLLGVNGAGKSTTFNMLTGDLLIDEGSAHIKGINIRSNITAARQQMGYCPQFDALIENMTGKETLYMYARIRGIPRNKMDTVVDELMDTLQLTVYADKNVGTYSGGNKRKMSTAIALVGCPPLVFLDEPSSGMDPVTRRKLWNVLSSVRDNGQSIVITSHSMEECEALCTRMAIMVNGQFQCIGSLQRLKSRFGSGFTLICNTRRDSNNNNAADVTDNPMVKTGIDVNPDAQKLKEFIEQKFPGCELKDSHLTGSIGYLHYELNGQHHKWSELFSVIENAKQQYNISDYIISQTTLEQIFLNFARHQHAEFI